MAEPASKLTERLRNAADHTKVNYRRDLLREAARALEQAENLLAGVQSKTALDVVAEKLAALERASRAEAKLEECEAYAKEGWDWLDKALRALGASTVFDIEARASALEQAEHDVIGLSTSVARLEAALEQAERDKASLRLEIEAWKHNGKKDNEYLLGKLEQAEKALRLIANETDVMNYELWVIARFALGALGGQDKQETT